MNILTEKKQFRSLLRQKRNDLSLQQRDKLSRVICEKTIALSLFQESRRIAFYLAHDGEVDIKNLLSEALIRKKACYLPTLQANQDYLDFRPYHAEDLLAKNRFGIEEPSFTQEKSIAVTTLDLMFLPLIAFDKKGNRLGRGAGCYDQTLASLQHSEKNPLLIGVAYEFQKVEKLPAEIWDIPLNLAVTEQKVYYF